MASVHQVALACNIDIRRVQQLVKEGVLSRDTRGEYDLGRCMMDYIKYLQAAMAARSAMDGDGKITNTAAQRSKLLAVEVALEELKLAKMRGEVITVMEYEEDLSSLVVETRAALMAVGARVAPHVLGQTSRATVQWAIDAGVKEAMSKLAARAPRRAPRARTKVATPARKKRKPARRRPGGSPTPAPAIAPS